MREKNLNVAFTYMLPMLLAISMYQDKKYTLRVGIGGIIVNVVYIVLRLISGGVDSGEIVNMEIQMAVMLLIVSFSYVTTNTLGIISDYKMGMIAAEKEKVDGMLGQIIHATDSLCTDIVSINQESRQMAD